MSVDVTYHTIAESEIEYYLLEPMRVRMPKTLEQLVPPRVHTLTTDPAEQERLQKYLYKSFFDLLQRPEYKESIFPVHYYAGVIAGYLRPYWYGVSSTLEYLDQELQSDSSFYPEGLVDVIPDDIADNYGYFTSTDTSYAWLDSAYISPKSVRGMRECLYEEIQEGILSMTDVISYSGLFFALQDAEKHGLGVLEVHDLFTTFPAQQTASDPNNLHTLILRPTWPHVYIGVPPDTKDIKKTAMEFANAEPEDYASFLKNSAFNDLIH